MMKVRSAIFALLLFLILPGCLRNPGFLVRYGEKRLEYLLEVTDEWEKPGVVLTEDKIKQKLGKPGFLKPVYETNLNLASTKTQKTLRDLEKDKGVLLEYYPKNLYEVLSGKHGNLKDLKLLSYVYDRMGFEDPSLTFYIGSLEGTAGNRSTVFGWDYVRYGTKNRCNRVAGRQRLDGFKVKKPEDCLRLPYTFLIDTIIGLKQFAGEIIKSPISFLEAELFENMIMEKKIPFYKLDGFKAAGEDWRNGITALTYRYRIDGNQGILATTQNLLGEIPVIGSVFDQWYKADSGESEKIFLTRGIYGGDDSAQNMDLWARYLNNPPEEECPTGQSGSVIQEGTNPAAVKMIPYRYGSCADVFWALFNISHGYAYEMASEIVSKCDVHREESVALSGHSGGVQRCIATARILNDDGIKVTRIHGIAGPAMGYSPCKNIRVVLNRKFMDDPVTEISRFLRYLFLDILTLNIDWALDDRNARNKDKEYYKHKTPGFVDGRTRLKYDGFLCENYQYLLQ